MTAPDYKSLKFDPTPLIVPARRVMIHLFRLRAAVMAEPYVSAIDLYTYLNRMGDGSDRRWSGVIFTAPRFLWRRLGYIPNPRRNYSPTPLFALNEERARDLGL